MSFKQDRIENEKSDPSEGSSLKYINVPMVLLALFLGFGVTYLALETDAVSMKEGDSRTPPEVAVTENTGAGTAPTTTSNLEQTLEQGKKLYSIHCQACHQATGAGIPGAFPPLVKSQWVSGSPQRLVAIMLHGLQGEITVNGQKFNSVMPPFNAQLSSADIAQIATYVRNAFENKAEPVETELVEKVKENTASRANPWDGEAELNAQVWE